MKKNEDNQFCGINHNGYLYLYLLHRTVKWKQQYKKLQDLYINKSTCIELTERERELESLRAYCIIYCLNFFFNLIFVGVGE